MDKKRRVQVIKWSHGLGRYPIGRAYTNYIFGKRENEIEFKDGMEYKYQ